MLGAIFASSSLSVGCCVNTLYKPPLGQKTRPIGKSYVSIVDGEKSAFEQGHKHRQNGHKNPATSMVSAFADKGRRRQLMRKY